MNALRPRSLSSSSMMWGHVFTAVVLAAILPVLAPAALSSTFSSLKTRDMETSGSPGAEPRDLPTDEMRATRTMSSTVAATRENLGTVGLLKKSPFMRVVEIEHCLGLRCDHKWSWVI